MSDIQYNCTSCGKPVTEEEALEVKKIIRQTNIKTSLEIINLILKITLAVVVASHLPELLDAI